jgi:hypothetical protein
MHRIAHGCLGALLAKVSKTSGLWPYAYDYKWKRSNIGGSWARHFSKDRLVEPFVHSSLVADECTKGPERKLCGQVIELGAPPSKRLP